jgi:hypothetical protein
MTFAVTTFIPPSEPTSLWVLTGETVTHIDQVSGRSDTMKTLDFIKMVNRIRQERERAARPEPHTYL